MSNCEPNPPSHDAMQQVTKFCQSIDWYHEGQSRTAEVAGIEVTVRLIARNGRRARIAITGPAGTVFRDLE